MKRRPPLLAAPVAAAKLRIPLPMLEPMASVGVNARAGQYLVDTVDMREVVNAARARYRPHEGKREVARRLRQIRAGVLQVAR